MGSEVNGWRDMASAPKDGAWILLWVTPGRLDIREDASCVIATWDTILKPSWVDERGHDIEEIPSHWQPLPSAPATGATP